MKIKPRSRREKVTTVVQRNLDEKIPGVTMDESKFDILCKLFVMVFWGAIVLLVALILSTWNCK
jgi:hypothetical protein